MDDQTKKWIIGTVIFLVVVAVCIGAYYFIMSTPLDKGLGNFLGAVGGFLGAAGQQIKTCNKVGYFNVGKGCYIGIVGLGVGLVFGAFKLASLWVNYKSNLVKKAATLTNKSEDEVVAKALEGIDMDVIMNDKNLSDAQKADAVQKAMIEKVNKNAADAVNEQAKNPDVAKSEIAELAAIADAEHNDVNDAAEEEGQSEADREASDAAAAEAAGEAP